jgi:FKBP-type peptidyl-prolyl cis-trans isomerase FklB
MRIALVFFAALLALAPLPMPAHAADAAPSLEANQAFLAANAKKPGVVTLASGLQYRVLRSGAGKRVAPTDLVQIAYTARLIDGTVVDGTSPVLPATVAVGGILRGLSEALQMMHVGDHWQVVMPTNLAYGAAGAGAGRIPPDQALVFDVSLLSASPAPDAGTAPSDSPLSIVQSPGGYQKGAVLTLHP